ncbi:uncharacterized protein BDZ83DRAFT_307976 [Colletotrichum acutatum]|uniref:Uncharacterized protein n=1 Tax=Glomerella acutata TaxID=27357 RepID=A0AAD8UL05_GLOAC|nr:uncharacterized protein BDZ83DRAFT_307976 [Colletotrichum acutatum]KAK1725238.1 hypothetical protein BDZ83DRAFT_307976 [Colletotrichum acutatum]
MWRRRHNCKNRLRVMSTHLLLMAHKTRLHPHDQCYHIFSWSAGKTPPSLSLFTSNTLDIRQKPDRHHGYDMSTPIRHTSISRATRRFNTARLCLK